MFAGIYYYCGLEYWLFASDATVIYVICTRGVGVISEDGRNSPESNQNKMTLTSHLAQKTPKEASVARLGTGRREKEGGENRHITDAPGMSSSNKVASQQAENR